MGDKNLKIPVNAPGRYYVDCTCIDCKRCFIVAPDTFTRNDQFGSFFVYHQPSTPDEMARARAAMAVCPCETIGDDGDY
ncbi:MAG TPA: ferredoxin [Verrucomicrobiae bacterium]